MTRSPWTRRDLLIGGAAALAGAPRLSLAQFGGPSIHVLKDPNCGCCFAWIEILERDGFTLTTEASMGTLLMH